jgi:hypothetical protein
MLGGLNLQTNDGNSLLRPLRGAQIFVFAHILPTVYGVGVLLIDVQDCRLQGRNGIIQRHFQQRCFYGMARQGEIGEQNGRIRLGAHNPRIDSDVRCFHPQKLCSDFAQKFKCAISRLFDALQVE